MTDKIFRYYGQVGVIPIAVLKEESNVKAVVSYI